MFRCYAWFLIKKSCGSQKVVMLDLLVSRVSWRYLSRGSDLNVDFIPIVIRQQLRWLKEIWTSGSSSVSLEKRMLAELSSH